MFDGSSSLSAVELERGWASFECDAHGFLVAASPRVARTVWCRCGKRARIFRSGRAVDPDTLKPTAAKAKTLNRSGHPFIYGCGCGEDFGGRTLLKRHRVGGTKSKRCLSVEEMAARGWLMDQKGRWRQRIDSFSGRNGL